MGNSYGDELIASVWGHIWNLKVTIVSPNTPDLKCFHKCKRGMTALWRSDTKTGWQGTRETVEIPYTPVRATFVEITGFRPSFSLFLDPSSPGLTLIPTKDVQNKKLENVPYWFELFIAVIYIEWLT